MTCGERIKHRREMLGLSADDLAEKIGKNRATVFRYENGDIENVKLPIIAEIAKALDVSPGYLMGWESGYTPQSERFRDAVRSALDSYDPDDLSAAAENGVDVAFLDMLTKTSGPVTLDDAYKAAHELGEQISVLLGEGEVQPTMNDELDQELLRSYARLSPDEQRIVRAAIQSFLSAQAKPASE